MADVTCKFCKALLGVGNVYCLNCGTPVIESLTDDGPETIVRSDRPSTTSTGLNPSPWATVARVVAVLLTLVAVLGGFYLWMKYDDERSKRMRDMEDRERESNRIIANATNANAERNRRQVESITRQTPLPTATPVDVDQMRAEFEEYERRRRANAAANAANAAANSVSNAAIPANKPTNIPPPKILEFDKNGRRLRAICKNGEPSYWQFDKWATCGMNGGVARWNPLHPRN